MDCVLSVDSSSCFPCRPRRDGQTDRRNGKLTHAGADCHWPAWIMKAGASRRFGTFTGRSSPVTRPGKHRSVEASYRCSYDVTLQCVGWDGRSVGDGRPVVAGASLGASPGYFCGARAEAVRARYDRLRPRLGARLGFARPAWRERSPGLVLVHSSFALCWCCHL